MVQEGSHPVYEGENFAMLEKFYLSPKGRKLSQLIFLPHDPKDLSNLEKSLTPEALKKYRQEAEIKNVIFSLPKTKAESEYHLLNLLKEWGFPLDSLDVAVVGNDVFISDVAHKTFVSTNEEGTEAAAVTGIICSKSMPIKKTEHFDVKHSYAYLIMDGDMVLFRGRVSDKKPLVAIDFNAFLRLMLRPNKAVRIAYDSVSSSSSSIFCSSSLTAACDFSNFSFSSLSRSLYSSPVLMSTPDDPFNFR